MISLALRLIGILMFLGTMALLAIALVAAAFALGSGRLWLLRWIGGGVAAWLAIYALALAAGPVVTPRRSLAVGDEVAFCAFDCHLHLAIARVRSDTDVVVTFRLRSDARREPEYPSHLRVRLIDAAGIAHPPRAGSFREPLAAGDTLLRDLRFALPAGSAPAGVVVTWGEWEDYVVPGPENALVQRRRTLLLSERVVSAARN